MVVALGPGHIVLDGVPAPPPSDGGQSPNFWPVSVAAKWPQGSRSAWHGGRTRPSPDDFVLDGDMAPSPKGGTAPFPQFSAYLYCGQTAGYIKMPLGMEVASAQGTLCSVGTQLPLPKRGAEPPIFSPCLLWPKGCMDQDLSLIHISEPTRPY